MLQPEESGELLRLLPPSAIKLLSSNGRDLLQEIGIEVIREVVFDVLTGENLRDSTESLTRRRIASLNLALVTMFVKGYAADEGFVKRLPYEAADILRRRRLPKEERWLAHWILGLTDKAFQNVLRDDPLVLTSYRDKYIEVCAELVSRYSKEYGELQGNVVLSADVKAKINWLFVIYLCNAVGAQTLSIRGSEKSTWGKLFEKLILGSLLHMLGFKYVPSGNLSEYEGVFWLTSRDAKRESDATLLYKPGRGVRFDIGFIGRGNPEISLDKVTRFERQIVMGSSHWYMGTIILVDTIGKNSRIRELAKTVGGTIIQMSAAYWPVEVAQTLNKMLGFKHPLLDIVDMSDVEDFIRNRLASMPLEKFVGVSNQSPE